MEHSKAAELCSAASRLISDEAALAAECDRLLPPWSRPASLGSEANVDRSVEVDHNALVVLPHELHQITQYIIERLGCKDPATIERVTAVYKGFVHRHEGLTNTEFRGYVACLLTQGLRELENRCAAAGVRISRPSHESIGGQACGNACKSACVGPCGETLDDAHCTAREIACGAMCGGSLRKCPAPFAQNISPTVEQRSEMAAGNDLMQARHGREKSTKIVRFASSENAQPDSDVGGGAKTIAPSPQTRVAKEIETAAKAEGGNEETKDEESEWNTDAVRPVHWVPSLAEHNLQTAKAVATAKPGPHIFDMPPSSASPTQDARNPLDRCRAVEGQSSSFASANHQDWRLAPATSQIRVGETKSGFHGDKPLSHPLHDQGTAQNCSPTHALAVFPEKCYVATARAADAKGQDSQIEVLTQELSELSENLFRRSTQVPSSNSNLMVRVEQQYSDVPPRPSGGGNDIRSLADELDTLIQTIATRGGIVKPEDDAAAANEHRSAGVASVTAPAEAVPSRTAETASLCNSALAHGGAISECTGISFAVDFPALGTDDAPLPTPPTSPRTAELGGMTDVDGFLEESSGVASCVASEKAEFSTCQRVGSPGPTSSGAEHPLDQLDDGVALTTVAKPPHVMPPTGPNVNVFHDDISTVVADDRNQSELAKRSSPADLVSAAPARDVDPNVGRWPHGGGDHTENQHCHVINDAAVAVSMAEHGSQTRSTSWLAGATSSLSSGWKTFALAMDKIFVPGAGEENMERLTSASDTIGNASSASAVADTVGQRPGPWAGGGVRASAITCRAGADDAAVTTTAQSIGVGVSTATPQEFNGTDPGVDVVVSGNTPCGRAVLGDGANDGAVLPGDPRDVPPHALRPPSAEEMREVLVNEGLVVLIGVGGGRGCVPKRLCFDGRGTSLYVLDADSSVPSVFFGITGFGLCDLRRIVVSSPQHHEAPPVVAVEFEEGFLPLRLQSGALLGGLVGALQAACDGKVEVVERESV
eukprot:TRINITY_DN32760_c0_g1_i1.p1 TRINITY_DN32760_c0_g1~~TRINITY_DN32760_c0_g1_i1.p1  ORF type:complete len:995 (+),score=163.89 TRINITY_DN32760_c0_g1_i1:63-3047(+)